MRVIKKGATDQEVTIRIVDSGDGTPETAVEHNTSGIDLWYRRIGAAKTSITEAALSALTDAHSDGGIEHIGDGYYRLDVPDAAFASGANGVVIGGTVTGMVVIGCYVHLVDYDPQDTVRLGLTALPNAAADAAGGLPISDAGGLDLDAKIGALTFTTANKVDATVPNTQKVDVETIKTQTVTCAAGVTVYPAVGTTATVKSNHEIVYSTDFATNYNTTNDKWNVNLVDISGSAVSTMSEQLGVRVVGMASDVITAGIIQDGAIDAATFQAGAISAAAISSAAVAKINAGLVLATGTIGSTGNDTTHLHLDGLTYGDDEINNWLLVVFDVSTSEYHSRWIEDWVLSTELATVATLPFTPQDATDTYWLLPVRQDVTGGSGLDAAGVRAAIGLASANLDTQLADLPTNSELSTAVGTAQTGDSYAIVNSGTHGNAAIKGYVDDIGVAGAGLTAIPWNAAWDAEVQSECNDALVANNLDHLLLSAVDTDFATTVHLNSVIGHLADDGTTATFDRTTDSLEAFYNAFNARLTTARGGYLDNLNIGGNVASSSALSSLTDVVNAMGDNVTIIDGIVDEILLDTAEIGTAGAGLTNINLPNQTMDIVGNITGSLSGSVGSVTGNVGGNVTGSVGSISGITFPSNFAALGINASGHVSRVTLADTLTTYTGNTVQTGDAYGALTSAVPDNVPADGSRPTVQQAVRMILQVLTEGGISGTTWTVKKEDGSTTLMTVTLDADPPTSKTRSG